MGITEGDDILAPAYNCGTEIDALIACNASVALYRVDRTSRIDLDDLRRRITQKTKAIYVIHYFGFLQPLSEIKKLCRERGIYLVEDCALSLFSSNGETRIGSIGDISVFSFPKSLPVPDGGALVINNLDLASGDWSLRRPKLSTVGRAMLPLLKRGILRTCSGTKVSYPLVWSLLKSRCMSSHANNRTLNGRPEMPTSYYYDEQLNDTAISAITKRMLATFDIPLIIKRRRDNFSMFQNLLSGVRGIDPLYARLPEGVCPLYFPVIVKRRNQLCEKLNELSITAMAWWSGYHRVLSWDAYPEACFLKDNLLVLPVHHQLNEKHIRFISRALVELIRED
jgi:dTDP-4-amino-4,6-dideoxygalactose transaminase